MVDEYLELLNLSASSWVRSDSSMVDEYLLRIALKRWSWWVQIPLWSMNTMLMIDKDKFKESSDSSMVDEYERQAQAFQGLA